MHSVNHITKYRSDTTGSILVEAALVMPLMIIIMTGVVELSMYIQAQQRVEKTTNMVANAIAGMRTYDAAEMQAIVDAAGNQGDNYKPSIYVSICRNGVEVGAPAYFESGVCMSGRRADIELSGCTMTGPGSSFYIQADVACGFSAPISIGLFSNERIHSFGYAPYIYNMTGLRN